jgi:hypothetical protein
LLVREGKLVVSKCNSVEEDSILLNVVYLERKNDRSFEDRKKMVMEIKAFFFKTLYHWIVTCDWFHISSFQVFLDFFFL